MNARKVLITLMLVIITVLGVSAAYAQQDPGGRPGGRQGDGRQRDGLLHEIVNIVAQETGLDPADIMTQVREGSTLAEVITNSGGDVEAVTASIVSAVTTRVQDAVAAGNMTQEQADTILASLEENVTSALNGEFVPGQGPIGRALRGAQILIDAAAEATGLDQQEILTQLRAGSTLADIITANGGDVDAVVAAAVASATEQINTAVSEGRITQEDADTRIASLEDNFTAMINGELREQMQQQGQRNMAVRGIIHLAAQETGLTEQEIVDQYRAGNSLASILTANGVDVNEFIDLAVSQAEERLTQSVENGRLTQEEADQRLTQLRDELTTRINEVPTPEAQSA